MMKGFLHDFSDSGHSFTVPEVGRLSVGEFVPGQGQKSGYPRSLDHFRIYKVDKVAEAAFRRVYGDKPTELRCTFLNSDPVDVCRTQYELRCGKVKYAYGDGEEFMYWVPADPAQPNNGKGSMVQQVCSTAEERDAFMAEQLVAAQAAARAAKLKSAGQIAWKVNLRLKVVLPDVAAGFWVLNTGGEVTSIQNIAGVFRTVLLAAKTVQLLPFRLKVEMHSGDTMERKRYPIITLMPPSGDVQAAVRQHGGQLFESMFGSLGNVYGVGEAEIIQAARQLNEGTGLRYNAAPVQEEVPEPDTLMESQADNYFAGAPQQPQAQLTEGNPGDLSELEPGSLAYALRRVTTASTWILLHTAWDEAGDFQGTAALRKAYVLRAAALCPKREYLDALVKLWKQFHSDPQFIAAVTARRKAKGWQHQQA